MGRPWKILLLDLLQFQKYWELPLTLIWEEVRVYAKEEVKVYTTNQVALARKRQARINKISSVYIHT